MKTTMTIVQHRVLRIAWSCLPSPTVQRVCMQGVIRCLLPVGVVRPYIGLCGKPRSSEEAT